MKHIRFTLLLFMLTCTSLSQGFTQHAKEYSFRDEGVVEIIELRNFDEDALAVYKQDDEFIYTEVQRDDNGIASVLRRWLSKLLNPIARGLSSKLIQYLLVVLMAGALIWFLISTNSSSILSKKTGSQGRYVEELDIRVGENILIDKLQKAESEGDYRNAIRFSYLLNLKAMDERKIIRWKEYKLSSDYLAEMKTKPLKNSFNDMTMYFNFAWYGSRKVSTEMYQEVKLKFSDLSSKIQDV